MQGNFEPVHWLGMLVALLLAACAAGPGETPPGEESLPLHLPRAQSLEKDGITVRLAIPTEKAVVEHFGVELARHNIQPIWMRIENDTGEDYWLLPIAIDRDYYSADEAALVTTADLRKDERSEKKQFFRANALPFFITKGSSVEGYVYATHTRGGRFVDVRLTRAGGKAVRLRFAALLPTEGFDYEKSALRQQYAQVDEYPDLTVSQLRERLRALPCCTTSADGSGAGDPLNIVLVGTGEEMVGALVAAGWSFTEAITADSIRRMVGAAIAEKSLLTAPVSALYLFDRKQDIALQRGRLTISQRNHLRLWLAPFRCEGEPVWVGQVSRDIGVKATAKSPTLTTHVIDPNVDESREYLLHSLLYLEAVSRFAFVRGVGEAGQDDPRLNLTDDPYFTDGMRMVIWLSAEPVPSEQAINLKWNLSTDPVLEAKGENAKVPEAEP